MYPRFGPTSEWDTAAGQCVLEAAGGAVLDPKGRPLRYNQRDTLLNGDFIALGDPALPWRDWTGRMSIDDRRRRIDPTTLLAIMARLRDPSGGCPWDVQQTFATIAPYTIEEAYEVADAIDRSDLPALRTNSATCCCRWCSMRAWREEQGAFAFADVVAAISDKMVRRHPHVFADAQVDDADGADASHGKSTSARERDAGGARRHVGAGRHRPRPAGMAARGEAAAQRGQGRLRLAGPGAGDRQAARGDRRGARRVRRGRGRSDGCDGARPAARTRSATCCSSAPTSRATPRSMSAPRCAAPTTSSNAASARWKPWPRRDGVVAARRCRWTRRTLLGTRQGRGAKTGAPMTRRFASFREFYPFYLGEHANRVSRRLHFIGSCGVLVLVVVAIVHAATLVAAGRAAVRLRVRLGRPLLLREEPARDLQAPDLFVHRGLGDVQGHPARARSSCSALLLRRRDLLRLAAEIALRLRREIREHRIRRDVLRQRLRIDLVERVVRRVV